MCSVRSWWVASCDHAVWLFISDAHSRLFVGCNIAFSKSCANIISSQPARPQDIAHRDRRVRRAPRPPRYSPAPAARTYCMRYGASAEAQAACVCSHASPRRARVAIDGPVGRRDMYMCTHNTMPVIHAPTTRTKKSTHTSATCATATRAPACGELRGSCAQSCCKLESRLAPRRAAARRSRCATVAAARGPAITAAAIVPAAAEAASSATPAAAEVAPDATGPQPSPTAVEASPLRPQVPEARCERGGSERRRTAVRGVFEASTPGAWLPARRPEKRTCGGGKGGTQRGPPHAALGIVRMAYTSRERAAGRHGRQRDGRQATRARAAAVLLSAAEGCYAPRRKKCISSSSPEWCRRASPCCKHIAHESPAPEEPTLTDAVNLRKRAKLLAALGRGFLGRWTTRPRRQTSQSSWSNYCRPHAMPRSTARSSGPKRRGEL